MSLTARFINRSHNALSVLWDFGDGTTSSERNPTHTYALAGAYVVTLTAANAHGVSERQVVAIVTDAETTLLLATVAGDAIATDDSDPLAIIE